MIQLKKILLYGCQRKNAEKDKERINECIFIWIRIYVYKSSKMGLIFISCFSISIAKAKKYLEAPRTIQVLNTN